MLDASFQVDESRISQQVRTIDASTEFRPIALRVEEHELNPAPVARPVGARQRVATLTGDAREFGVVSAWLSATSAESVHIAEESSDISTSDP